MPVATRRTSRMKPLRLCVAFFISLIPFAEHGAFAQRQTLLNPAAPTSLWLSGLSPAAMSFQEGRLVIGSEILHAGFLPERALGVNEHRLLLTFPYALPYDFAFGFALRAFHAQIYSELESSLLFSKKIFRQLALGIKLGYTSRAFDRGQFQQVDLSDPLLQGKNQRRTSPLLSASLRWRIKALTAAANVDYLNRPNLGFAEKATQPRFFALGLNYDLGIIAPSVTWNHDGVRRRFGFEVAAQISPMALARLSYERSGPIRFETQLQLQRNAKLAYGVNLPSGAIGAASSGTHELIYEHVLSREPEIGAPVLVLSTQRMNITHTTSQYVVAPGVARNALEESHLMAEEYLAPQTQLGNLAIVPLMGLDDSEAAQRELSRSAAVAMEAHGLREVVLRIAPGARMSARSFEKRLRQDLDGKEVRIMSSFQKKHDAVSLASFRSGMPSSHVPILSHENLLINLVVPGQRRYVQEWRLEILAPNTTVVKNFSGTHRLPSTLSWNWRDISDALVPAGEYRCKLTLTSGAGKKYAATSEVMVTHTRRRMTVHLKQAPTRFELREERTEASAR